MFNMPTSRPGSMSLTIWELMSRVWFMPTFDIPEWFHSWCPSSVSHSFLRWTRIISEQYGADWRQIFLRICELSVFSEGEKFAVMFSFSTSLWPSPDHSSSPLDDTETSSPRKETPCSPVGRQYKVHCNSCVFVCMSVFKRNGGKRRTVSIHTLADSLK